MPAPSAQPQWATTGTIVEPNTGKKELGWETSERPPAGYFNWWQNLVYQWTQWLEAERARISGYIGGDDEYTYPVAKTRVLRLSPFTGLPTRSDDAGSDGWYPSVSGSIPNQGFVLTSRLAFAQAILPVGDLLPEGATITKVRALVNSGDTRAGASRMKLYRFTQTVDWAVPSHSYSGPLSEVFETGPGLQILDTGALSLANTKATLHHVFVLQAGSTADVQRDSIYGWEVTFTDPGPRNF